MLRIDNLQTTRNAMRVRDKYAVPLATDMSGVNQTMSDDADYINASVNGSTITAWPQNSLSQQT